MNDILHTTVPFDATLWAADEAQWRQAEGPAAPEPQPDEASASRRAERIRKLTYRRSELDNIPPPTYLIDGVLNENVLALLAGKFGTYKSFVSVSWACSIATGIPWLGHEIPNPGPVIYIAAEGASGLRARISAWESVYYRGQRIPDDRLIVVGGSVNIRNSEDMGAISDLSTEVGPRLTIWDTMHRCAPGVEENSNTEMGLVRASLDRLRELHNCTQAVNHHTGHKGERGRGASSIEDDFDNSWVIKLGGDGEDRSPKNPRTMNHRKTKDGEHSEDIPIRLALCDESATIEKNPDAAASEDWIIEGRVRDLAAKCDAAGIPKDYGRDRLTAAATSAGIAGASNDLWNRVVKLRKAA